MHVETNITIVDKLWMEDGVKDMEMWNTCRNTNITIVDKLWMEDGVSKRYGNVECMQKPT